MSIVRNTREAPYYIDGITKATDPFWKVYCTCGFTFLSCISNGKCPKCGRVEGKRMLGKEHTKRSDPVRLLQRYVNNRRIFRTISRFEDYDPKKG